MQRKEIYNENKTTKKKTCLIIICYFSPYLSLSLCSPLSFPAVFILVMLILSNWNSREICDLRSVKIIIVR